MCCIPFSDTVLSVFSVSDSSWMGSTASGRQAIFVNNMSIRRDYNAHLYLPDSPATTHSRPLSLHVYGWFYNTSEHVICVSAISTALPVFVFGTVTIRLESSPTYRCGAQSRFVVVRPQPLPTVAAPAFDAAVRAPPLALLQLHSGSSTSSFAARPSLPPNKIDYDPLCEALYDARASVRWARLR